MLRSAKVTPTASPPDTKAAKVKAVKGKGRGKRDDYEAKPAIALDKVNDSKLRRELDSVSLQLIGIAAEKAKLKKLEEREGELKAQLFGLLKRSKLTRVESTKWRSAIVKGERAGTVQPTKLLDLGVSMETIAAATSKPTKFEYVRVDAIEAAK